jgi:hypothetical protein
MSNIPTNSTLALPHVPSQHTAGEWSNDVFGYITSKTNGAIVAKIANDSKSGLRWASELFPNQQLGNSLLISLAPRMFDLLHQARAVLPVTWEAIGRDHPTDLMASIDTILRKASYSEVAEPAGSLCFRLEAGVANGGCIIEHSEGPWNLGFYAYVFSIRNVSVVADVVAPANSQLRWASQPGSIETSANRKLISAVPELLAGLSQARAALPDIGFAERCSVDPKLITEINQVLESVTQHKSSMQRAA